MRLEKGVSDAWLAIFCLSLEWIIIQKGGVAGFSNGCAILFSNLVLAVFVLRIYWFKSIWKCQSVWMVWSGDDRVLHWFHFNLKLCIALGGSLSRMLVSFCWICSHAGRKSLSCLIKKLIFLKLLVSKCIEFIVKVVIDDFELLWTGNVEYGFGG